MNITKVREKYYFVDLPLGRVLARFTGRIWTNSANSASKSYGNATYTTAKHLQTCRNAAEGVANRWFDFREKKF